MTIIDEYLKFDNNLFKKPLSNNPPLGAFTRGDNDKHLAHKIYTDNKPTPTNKFYSNLLIDNQTSPFWTHPYVLNFHKFEDTDKFYGFSVNCNNNSNNKFINKTCVTVQNIDLKPFIFSSVDFHSKEEMYMTVSNMKEMSVQVHLKKNQSQFIWFPIVQGMGMFSAVYYNLVPKIQSEIGFKIIKQLPMLNTTSFKSGKRNNIRKYRITLYDDSKWLLYVTERNFKNKKSEMISCLRIKDFHTIVGNKYSKGSIFQLVPDIFDNLNDIEALDRSVGCYPLDCHLSTSIDSLSFENCNAKSNYLMYDYNLGGKEFSETPLIFLLPHHQKLVTKDTKKYIVQSFINSHVLGSMRGYLTSKVILKLDPPRLKSFGQQLELASDSSLLNFDTFKMDNDVSMSKMLKTANEELLNFSNDLENIENCRDIRILGEYFFKYSWFLYCSYFVLHDINLTLKVLQLLKNAFNKFINDTLFNDILQYDTRWGGLITSSQYTDNYYYNEHNYDYSYFIIASAIIGKIESTLLELNNPSELLQEYIKNTSKLWLENEIVLEWCENLIRDYNNPSDEDYYFPSFRSFDWYHGHSWSTGLFESQNGKEYYSSGEDLNSLYAINLWGFVTNNKRLIDLSNIQLSLFKCSINTYVQYNECEQDKMLRYYNKNNIESIPRVFKQNMVCGMLSDNRLYYKTVRGLELTSQTKIHLQHILPINPLTNWVRENSFIEKEYNDVIYGLVESLTNNCQKNSGEKKELLDPDCQSSETFKVSLLLNLAPIKPSKVLEYLLNKSPNNYNLSKSLSLTWSLIYAMSFNKSVSDQVDEQ